MEPSGKSGADPGQELIVPATCPCTRRELPEKCVLCWPTAGVTLPEIATTWALDGYRGVWVLRLPWEIRVRLERVICAKLKVRDVNAATEEAIERVLIDLPGLVGGA